MSHPFLPTWDEFLADLVYVPAGEPPASIEGAQIFDGQAWARWTALNWRIPIGMTLAYSLLIPALTYFMRGREKVQMRNLLLVWNFSLSLFSIIGAIVTVPKFFWMQRSGIMDNGFYNSVCSPAGPRLDGYCGFFVIIFIYSKNLELVDTVFLALRKAPLTLLHCWHHISVTLYCWHAYSIQAGTGLWFTVMNYCVHGLMYGYFGCTQLSEGHRKAVKPYAIVLTLMQLLQMMVGIGVTVASMVYTSQGKECHANNTNALLGLLMYASYFALFLQFFVTQYFCRKKKKTKGN
jgi:hypothetical protein